MPENRLNLISFVDRTVFVSVLVLLVSLTFSTALMEIASVVAITGWVILKFGRPGPFPFERKSFIALSCFVFLSVVSFFWSDFPRQSFRGIFKVLQHFAVFWVAAETLHTPFRQKKAFQVLLFCFIYLGLDGIWQYAFGKDLVRAISFEPASSGPRISASFKNYGLLAAFVLSFLPLTFGDREKKAGFWHLAVPSLAVVFGLLLLFWTRLRGSWVALVGGLLFFLWLSKNRIYVLTAILVVAIGIFLLPRSMLIHLDSEGKEQSLVERFYLWDRAWQVIQARPLTGTGINTYAVAHQKYDDRGNWRVRDYYAHNGYLQIAAETGLPSLACFFAFLFFYFSNAFKGLERMPDGGKKRTLIAFLAGMVNFLILGLIDTIFHNAPSIIGFWFLAGWCAAYQNLFAPNPGAFSPQD